MVGAHRPHPVRSTGRFGRSPGRIGSLSIAILAPGALALAAGTTLARDVTYRTVVLTGQPAPGLAGVTFAAVTDPRINASGQVAFWAALAGTGVTTSNDGSIWSDRSGSLALILREEDQIPTGAPRFYGAFPWPAFNDAGELALTASFYDANPPPDPTTLGIFREDSIGFFLVEAIEGSAAPGLGSTPFSNLPPVEFNGAGHIAFNANRGVGVWANTGMGLSLMAKSGDALPGLQPNFLGHLNEPLVNPTGTIAFTGTLFDNPALSGQPDGAGLVSTHPLGPQGVTQTGAPAPGTPGTFTVFGPPRLNDESNIAIWGAIVGPGVTGVNDAGIWVNPAVGQPGPRLREGDPAVGVPGSVFFTSFSPHVAFNDARHLAVRAVVYGDNVTTGSNSGIWLARHNGSTFLVAREGDQVPRLPAGVLYSGFDDPHLNVGTQLVFLARLRGTGVTTANNVALVATDRPAPSASGPPGRLYPVLRTGDTLEVAPGDHRIIEQILFEDRGPSSGRSGLNADGRLIVKLVFKDPQPPPALARISEAIVVVDVGCLPDVNGDGQLNVNDYIAFQTAFALGDLRRADFSGDGTLNVTDYIAFQTAFALGCP